jgi:hypothetical protein
MMVKGGTPARVLAALVGAMFLLSVVAVSGAAAGGGATVASGIQLAAGTCENGGYEMTGSLTGCWWIDAFESRTDPARHNFRATGTEHFTGCLGEVCGTFTTTYSFSAKMAGPWGTSTTEIHGRCHHPITGGTDGFAGASGELTFHDVVDVSPPYYPYTGSIRLGRSAGASTLVARMIPSATAATAGC